MTEIPSYSLQNPNHLDPYKHKKRYISSSLITIFLSILTCFLIFYIPDMSFSSMFNNTKVLFFVSNALILIIAADYGAFTDKENRDVYEEFTAKMRSNTRDDNPRNENTNYTVNSAEEIKKREEQESTKDISCTLLHDNDEFPEKIIQVATESQPRDMTIENQKTKTDQNVPKTDVNGVTCNARNQENPKPYGRSKSEKACRSEKRRVKSYDRRKSESSKWMVVCKEVKAEETKEEWENVREESEEFSKMSNEELNNRIEEFIERFNGEIKRQASRK